MAKRFSIICIVAMLVGIADFWVSRFVIFSDGISYLEIARKYASGDWANAINAYWSPLYSWILAFARIIFGNNDRMELLSLHFVNLLAYFASLFIFERLLRKLASLHSWQSQKAYKVFILCAYLIFLWASIYMIGIGYCSPDMIIFALNLLLTLQLINIRHNASALSLFAIGCVLAFVYFAKAAMFPLAITYVIAACVSRPLTIAALKRSIAIIIPFVILATPWIFALHEKTGTWTFGESGKLNYAWEVCGAARSTHWQGEPGNIGRPVHPTRQVFTHPDVFEFASPIDATYAPWFDPSYWYQGVTPTFTLSKQLQVIAISLRYAFVLMLLAPGLLLAILSLIFSPSAKTGYERTYSLWFLIFPSISTILLYAMVYIDKRYIAGNLLVICIILIYSSLSLATSERWLLAIKSAAIAACLLFFGVSLGSQVAIKTIIPDSPRFTEQQNIIASEMMYLGLRRGDKIGYIGLGINAYWALLDEVRIVAEVPVIFKRNGRLNNYLLDDYSEIKQFWSLDNDAKSKILALMKSFGTRAIVSDIVPPGADTSGWHKLKGKSFTQNGASDVFVLFLQ